MPTLKRRPRPAPVEEPVRQLQTLLRMPERDGKFGADTETALRKFQQDRGMEPTGVADEATWAALFAEADKSQSAVDTVRQLIPTVSASQIGWGSYSVYEGPWFKGRRKYELPSEPDFADRLIEVVTATEGGALDAVNGYDKCIFTGGAIQWCEAGMFGVSNLLGAVAAVDPDAVLNAYAPALALTGAKFVEISKGVWRFRFPDQRGVVDTQTDQRSLYLGGATIGQKGTWNANAKSYARSMAAAFANVWVSDAACTAQVEFTAARMMTFVWGKAMDVLFAAELEPEDHGGMVGALRCAYVSFAASLPAVAQKQFEAFLKATTAKPWSLDWAVELLDKLTYGPGIAIYPNRYDRIRPVLESTWGVDLPDFAKQLRTAAADSRSFTPREIQQALLDLGYDLGPSGVDGALGTLSKRAIKEFQTSIGREANGVLDVDSARALRAA